VKPRQNHDGDRYRDPVDEAPHRCFDTPTSESCDHRGEEVAVPPVKTVKIIAALLIGLFLSVPHAAFAQRGLDEAISLNNQASELLHAGRYSEAEPLFKRSLAIRERVLGPNHPDVATALNNLAALYHAQGRDADAEPLYKRALSILDKAPGTNESHVARSLNSLAEVYRAQGRYAEAEPLYKRALAIQKKFLGSEHLDVATSLNNWDCFIRTRVSMSKPSHFSKAVWRYGKRRAVPITPMSGSRSTI
jgi:tetratricopeptide (TPR) repeat protein